MACGEIVVDAPAVSINQTLLSRLEGNKPFGPAMLTILSILGRESERAGESPPNRPPAGQTICVGQAVAAVFG